jgi:hypothetical protein
VRSAYKFSPVAQGVSFRFDYHRGIPGNWALIVGEPGEFSKVVEVGRYVGLI